MQTRTETKTEWEANGSEKKAKKKNEKGAGDKPQEIGYSSEKRRELIESDGSRDLTCVVFDSTRWGRGGWVAHRIELDKARMYTVPAVSDRGHLRSGRRSPPPAKFISRVSKSPG